MWIYLIAGVLILMGLVGTAFGAGIFTIVLIPIGVLILASAVGYGMWARAQQGAVGGETDAHPPVTEPLPHNPPQDSGHAPTSPDALVDARRAQQ